jgi:hypothetical protein
VAHHANFDANILRAVNPFLDLPLSKIDCTMGRAQAIALPGGLDKFARRWACEARTRAAVRLVMATCKPQRDGTFNEDVETYRELVAYNVQDKRALIDVDARCRRCPPPNA